MIGARVFAYITDTQTVGGTITAVGGRFDDIRAVQWDDGVTSYVGSHEIGVAWDYED